ncbi:MAG: hypothetical protein ACYTGQ_08030 [Planctomycetota bacterium]|jgi:hypothetical protein
MKLSEKNKVISWVGYLFLIFVIALNFFVIFQDYVVQKRLEQQKASQKQALIEIRKMDGRITYYWGPDERHWAVRTLDIPALVKTDKGYYLEDVPGASKLTDEGMGHLEAVVQ